MYRTICTELWSDPEITALDVSTRYLFLYLITNPHTHLSGIYYLPDTTLLQESGLNQIPYRYGIDTLSKLKKAYRDDRTQTIFVSNMFFYQGRGTKNDIAAARHLATLHHSCLIPLFLARYPQVKPLYNGYPIDTPSNISAPVPDPVLLTSSPNPTPELKHKRIRKLNGGPVDAMTFPEDFAPSENHAKLCAARGLELNIEVNHFRGRAQELGWKSGNWPLKFTNWIFQEIKFRQRRPS